MLITARSKRVNGIARGLTLINKNDFGFWGKDGVGIKTPLLSLTTALMSFTSTLVAKKRGKIVTFLRLFLSSRPSKARLLQSGILK